MGLVRATIRSEAAEGSRLVKRRLVVRQDVADRGAKLPLAARSRKRRRLVWASRPVRPAELAARVPGDVAAETIA